MPQALELMMKNPALARVATSTFDRSRTKRHGRFESTIWPTDSSSSAAVGERPPPRSSPACISLRLPHPQVPYAPLPLGSPSHSHHVFSLGCSYVKAGVLVMVL